MFTVIREEGCWAIRSTMTGETVYNDESLALVSEVLACLNDTSGVDWTSEVAEVAENIMRSEALG